MPDPLARLALEHQVVPSGARAEQLDAEKRDVAEQIKELMAEAKGRGYDTKVLRKVIALRKRKPDDVAEEDAILELYKTALGMG